MHVHQDTFSVLSRTVSELERCSDPLQITTIIAIGSTCVTRNIPREFHHDTFGRPSKQHEPAFHTFQASNAGDDRFVGRTDLSDEPETRDKIWHPGTGRHGDGSFYCQAKVERTVLILEQLFFCTRPPQSFINLNSRTCHMCRPLPHECSPRS